MPLEGRRIVRALLQSDRGELSSAQVEDITGRSRSTALKYMRTLHVLGAAQVTDGSDGAQIGLREDEGWFLEEENRWTLGRLP